MRARYGRGTVHDKAVSGYLEEPGVVANSTTETYAALRRGYGVQANHSAIILRSGGLRIDHVYTRIARTHGGKPEPITYQRLILRCMFPNGDHALVTLVERTNTIQIIGANLDTLPAMDPAML